MNNIIKFKAYFMGLFNLLIFFSKRIIQSCLNSTYRKKLFRLFTDNERLRSTVWCVFNSDSFDRFAININRHEWKKALEFRSYVRKEYKEKVKGLPISGGIAGSVGGGGVDPAKIYFLTKILAPKIVVETGVSSGVSSRSFLEAMKENEVGNLHSSDLRVFLPEGKTGFMVPNELRENWFLYSEGDEINIPLIINQVDKIDLFHYDSLKSYKEIEKTLNSLSRCFHSKTVIILDDIDRNSFFKDKHFPDSKKLIFNNVGVFIPQTIYRKLINK